MLRTTQDILELRHWAEARGARPVREEATGRLWLAIPGQPCSAREVGWDEFEPTFMITHCVFVYEDAPGARHFYIGGVEEAHAFLMREVRAGSAR